MKIAVFVSGNGSNLQCIIDSSKSSALSGTIVDFVIADRKCFAIERAERENIEWVIVDRKVNWQNEIHCILKNRGTELIVLAGFLSILDKSFCDEWENKIIKTNRIKPWRRVCQAFIPT